MAVVPRLHVEAPSLRRGATVSLDAARTHYLVRVLRLAPGAEVRPFNAVEGEWRARLTEVGRRSAVLTVEERRRPPRPEPGPALWFAPPKRLRLEWLVEKAVELGVGRLLPVLTERTVAVPRRPERLLAIAVEAAEQCGRLSVPEIAPPRPLVAVLAEEAPPVLLFADETGGGRPLPEALREAPAAALLVGPEGGFAPAEKAALLARTEVRAVSLGSTILRSETAALYMLSCWRASRETAT